MPDAAFAECFVLVPDLGEIRTFYEEALGLSIASEGTDSVTYDVAGTPLKLQADYPEETFETFNLTVPAPTGRGQGAMLALDLDEPIETVHERVTESDGTALFEPREVPWLDAPIFLAEDPVGYCFEIR